MSTRFILAECSDDKFSNVSQYIRNKFDFTIKNECFKNNTGYNILYKYILSKTSTTDKIITISGSHAVSVGTILAQNDKFKDQSLKVLYIDQCPDINVNSTNPNNSVVSLLLNIVEANISSKNKISPSQIIYICLDDKNIGQEEMELINELGITFLTMRKISQIGTDKMISYLSNIINKSPLHVSLDMIAIDKSIAPAVKRSESNISGLLLGDIEKLFGSLQKNIVSMDIIGINGEIIENNEKESIKKIKLTSEIAKFCITRGIGLNEKQINLFSDDTKFMIYRPLSQEDDTGNIQAFTDVGWYILRGIPLSDREKLMSLIDDNDINQYEIDGEDYLITKTSMAEQNKKSYYTASDFRECCLFPAEKTAMLFELLNTQKLV